MLKFLSLLPRLIFVFYFLFSSTVCAVDIIKVTNSQSTMDKRTKHKDEIIIRALELTTPKYGAYEYNIVDIRMNRHRALPAIIKGEPNNVYVAPANNEWDKKTIAIKIPIRRGLLNYRLLLVHKDDLPRFSQVKALEDLKELNAGLRSGWATTEVFRKANMMFVEGQNFDGLFLLLDSHRFNYIPRAVYEIYDELDARKHLLKNVVVEPNLALHLPMPTYIYVSPAEPRIANRLTEGLNIMLKNGELDAILNKYYADDIERANLKNRRVIKMDNPYYQDKDLLNDQRLWYQL